MCQKIKKCSPLVIFLLILMSISLDSVLILFGEKSFKLIEITAKWQHSFLSSERDD